MRNEAQRREHVALRAAWRWCARPLRGGIVAADDFDLTALAVAPHRDDRNRHAVDGAVARHRPGKRLPAVGPSLLGLIVRSQPPSHAATRRRPRPRPW